MYHHLWLLWQTSSLRGRMSHKKQDSDKHKRQQAERQKTQTPTRTPQKGDKGGKGGGTPNPQRRLSAPVTSPSPAEGDPKKRPQGDNSSPEGNNSKKRRLAWMAKSLVAARVDVKFPAEE